jgi:hypothetical protein
MVNQPMPIIIVLTISTIANSSGVLRTQRADRGRGQPCSDAGNTWNLDQNDVFAAYPVKQIELVSIEIKTNQLNESFSIFRCIIPPFLLDIVTGSSTI